MKNINLFLMISITVIVLISCEKESTDKNSINSKLVGSWIWTAEDGSTVQVDTNEYNVYIGGCSEQMEYKEIITWETIWEFEIDGDFEEKLSYDNMENDFHESQKYCKEKYENIIYTREMIGSWEIENNNSGLEIKQKSYYGNDTIHHDYLIVNISETELILQKDDIKKTKLTFKKWE
jgi:hypothetical protein